MLNMGTTCTHTLLPKGLEHMKLHTFTSYTLKPYSHIPCRSPAALLPRSMLIHTSCRSHVALCCGLERSLQNGMDRVNQTLQHCVNHMGNTQSKPLAERHRYRYTQWGSMKNVVYRVSQEKWAILREGVPYVKLYRFNPQHLYPKFNVIEIMAEEVWNFDSCYTLTDCHIRIKRGRNMWFM
jgi:hypothetical protein